MRVALVCGAISVALGSFYLLAAGAPRRYVVANAGALALGLALTMLGRRLPVRRRATARRPHRGDVVVFAIADTGVPRRQPPYRIKRVAAIEERSNVPR